VPIQTTVDLSTLGMPEIPALAREILQWSNQTKDLESAVDLLVGKYPQFFERLLNIINSDYFSLSEKVNNIFEAIQYSSISRVTNLAMLQIIYRTFNQYKIVGVDMQDFWLDSLRRAVSAKMIGESIGLNGDLCFNAGFIQDVGYFLLFLEHPKKGVLWSELQKREPQARLSMEKNTFNQQHNKLLKNFLQKWNIFLEMKFALFSHHDSSVIYIKNNNTDNIDQKLCKVLHCADWMTAVFTADNKTYVIDQCRKILINNFKMQAYHAEIFLEAMPDEVNLNALLLGMPVKESVAFSQILYAANIRLNEDNVNFQELASRLDQALDERDRLAEELNRDLSLARKIQQSLLPENPGNDYPITGINISAKILSGDFYDFFELENGDIYFNLGDVSGKGVNAALLMAKTSSLFRCLGKRIKGPGELLFEINNELCETSIHGMFVTMVAGLYSPEKDEVRLVNSGNPPALLFLKNGICQEFKATAPPLGIVANTIYTEYKIKLSDSCLYLYSDGVTEGYINNDSMLELSGLFKLIATMDKCTLPIENLNKIINKITSSGKSLRDDATLLLLKNLKFNA